MSAASSTLEQRLVLTCKADISCCNMRHCILASFSAHDSEVLCCCVSQGVLSSNDVRCTKCRRNLFMHANNGQEWTILSHSSQSIPSCSAPVNRAWQSGAAVGGSARAVGVATLIEAGVRRLLRCAAALQAPREDQPSDSTNTCSPRCTRSTLSSTRPRISSQACNPNDLPSESWSVAVERCRMPFKLFRRSTESAIRGHRLSEMEPRAKLPGPAPYNPAGQNTPETGEPPGGPE